MPEAGERFSCLGPLGCCIFLLRRVAPRSDGEARGHWATGHAPVRQLGPSVGEGRKQAAVGSRDRHGTDNWGILGRLRRWCGGEARPRHEPRRITRFDDSGAPLLGRRRRVGNQMAWKAGLQQLQRVAAAHRRQGRRRSDTPRPHLTGFCPSQGQASRLKGVYVYVCTYVCDVADQKQTVACRQ